MEDEELPAYQSQWVRGEPADPSDDWLVAYGGRLYDHWLEALEQSPPKGTHPAYPRTAKQKGPDTWRCKECHGWDYKGAEGRYAQGSHATGIKGIRAMDGGDPARVVQILRDDTHRFTEKMIPAKAAERLALFVTRGQLDMDAIIEPASGRFKGDPARGKGPYQNLCAVCHGHDGKAQNFGNPREPEYLGTVAKDNPWELLHNARNGHPGTPMPASRWIDPAMLGDIGAYT
ncbi:MAG: c-type cytochrome, partial [Alphaproteobacteria bacterium]